MMGYGPEDKNAVLELTYNYGVTEYAKGNAYAQVCNLVFFAIWSQQSRGLTLYT
jgi:hypothetical protein